MCQRSGTRLDDRRCQVCPTNGMSEPTILGALGKFRWLTVTLKDGKLWSVKFTHPRGQGLFRTGRGSDYLK